MGLVNLAVGAPPIMHGASFKNRWEIVVKFVANLVAIHFATKISLSNLEFC